MCGCEHHDCHLCTFHHIWVQVKVLIASCGNHVCALHNSQRFCNGLNCFIQLACILIKSKSVPVHLHCSSPWHGVQGLFQILHLPEKPQTNSDSPRWCLYLWENCSSHYNCPVFNQPDISFNCCSACQAVPCAPQPPDAPQALTLPPICRVSSSPLWPHPSHRPSLPPPRSLHPSKV